mmetsp:Transcript_28360/g.64223  ORF Transcript_28360/g.64223 Transcript_28360/m.64223 type:complete len:431 (-) Transcript_28360:121-1413(-)|eukprot:CAMPEP_0197882212 /NCGR_PEP_ID=MMETSP1439-20131203/9440_1 /TAXON_ID=66791 /ORGANISM="Gonyaulax spinifera, Strain CCMP409" /LENGTH=430 /DNA_ID=CAMNT_0043501859 /DNA_START=81 /DNA_END=1373 /DNA_ORIENTATION=-
MTSKAAANGADYRALLPCESECAGADKEQAPVSVVVDEDETFKFFSLKNHIKKVKIQRDAITTTVMSRNSTKKILRYDMAALVKTSALTTLFLEGTVFTMDTTAVRNAVHMWGILAGTCLLTILVFITRFDQLAHVETAPLEHLAAQINAFVPFVLALYVSLTITRWWQLRVVALGKVFDALASICMLINNELHEKKWMEVRTHVAKYGFAGIELIVQAARNEPDMNRLLTQGMLTPEEVKSMERQEEPWQRPMVVWSWIMRICVAAMDHNFTPAPRTMAVMNQCLAARQGIANINTYLDTQLPFAYVHLITLLVNVQNVTLSAKAGIIFAKALPSLDFFVMIQQVATCTVVCFIYQALLQISYMILDPFGDEVLDFPCAAYMEYLAAHIDAMCEAQVDCPVVAQDGSIYRPRGKTAGGPDADSFDESEY